jgi:hypothetical protein
LQLKAFKNSFLGFSKDVHSHLGTSVLVSQVLDLYVACFFVFTLTLIASRMLGSQQWGDKKNTFLQYDIYIKIEIKLKRNQNTFEELIT